MHLKRFFCESGKEDRLLHDDVFIVSGERWQELFNVRENESLPKTWEWYAQVRSVVLLGPPRQGKTTEFRYQCGQVKNGFFLPLGKVPTMGGIEIFAQAIEHYDRWIAWRNGDESGELFIDSLDEGKLATRLMMRNLAAWLQSMEEHILRRLRIHLSCRGAEWERADQDKWLHIFESSGDGPQIGEKPKTIEVLVLLNLARSQYEEYCQAHDVDPRQLLNDLPIRARRFVARPQTLRMIVEDYRQSGQPPESITELYERVIARRLGEENPEHQQASRIIPIAIKRSVVELYAAITALSDRSLIADQGVDSLNSVPMGMSGHAHEVEEATFNSGLFQAPLRGEYRFDDPELAYYLGACYLSGLINGEVISIPRAIRLFFANPEEKDPIPKLRGMMVWLCALNPGFRRFVVGINPGILLDDFPVDFAVNDKLAAWNWLVERYGDRRFFDYRPWIEGVKALACPEIVPHLKEVLENPDKYGRDIRVLALQTSFAGNLTQLGPVIELCCKDQKDDPYFLTEAADVLKKLCAERVEVLKPWLNLSPPEDPSNRLLNSALEALWPDYLSIHEVVGYLRPPLTNDGSDGLFGFLYDLPDKLSPEDLGVVIDSMAEDLEIILHKKDAEKPQQYREKLPSQWIMKFLISQVNSWKNNPIHMPKLEKWISIALRAGMLLSVYFPNREEFLKLIEEDRNFRHELEVTRIQRVMKEKGAEFDPTRHEVGENYFPKAEDFPLWKETLLAWLEGDHRLTQAFWDKLYTSWCQAGNPPEFVIWVEELSKKNDLIRHLWDESKSWKVQDWHREDIERKKEQREKREKTKEHILKNKDLIIEGNFNLLAHLYNISEHKEKSIEEEYGVEIVSAYSAGLLSFWRNALLPPLEDYYSTNSIPWMVLLIIGAVSMWKQGTGASWADISQPMRRAALQAGLSDLNKFPDWYEELIEIEPDAFHEIAFAALNLEARSKTDYPTLAHRLKHNAFSGLFRNIALDYLKQNPTLRSDVLIPLAEAQIIEKPSEEVIDFLWGLGRHRLTDFGRHSGLSILALVWLYRPEIVWSWLNDNFLGIGEARTECFRDWVNAILAMHVSHRFGKWPALIDPNALMALMSDYFAIYPPQTDPTIEEINKNIPSIQHRSDLATLRNDAMAKISESGSAEAGRFLTEWVSDRVRSQYRDHILYHLDRWYQARVEKGWQPFSPQDLMGILTQGLRPVRSHNELYALVVDILGEIKAELEGGQDNLKHLCWIFQGKKAIAPAGETNLQIVLAREIRKCMLGSRIVGNREVSITDENQPDLKVETRLENDQAAVVYIEVKRQSHAEILTSIESQLANKYLIDPQSRYGIYFVGWYGNLKEFWTAPQKEIGAKCGDIPNTPKDLEDCLQRLADDVVQNRNDIDGIKVMVADLSLTRFEGRSE